MPDHFDVIVIGVGAMGAAACYHAARRGLRVLGLEQFDIPHTRGSSHGFSRMTRMAYYEQARYVPLLRSANALWRELEAESGQVLLNQVGGIFIGPPDRELVNHSRLAAELHGLNHEVLSADEVKRRWPMFETPGDWVGLFDPGAGFLLPEKCILAHVDGARRRGADIRTQQTVRSWRSVASHVAVTTDAGEFTADRLIITAGPWAGKLLGDLDVPLRVTRQVLGWVRPDQPERFAHGRFPVWALDGMAAGGIYYGFPILAGETGLKLAHHHPGTTFDPDTPSRDTTPADEADFRPALQQYIPSANGPIEKRVMCLYTNSPDEDFIIDRHPQYQNVDIACGFSGHGFKFASVIGQILANRTEVEFLSLKRLATKR